MSKSPIERVFGLLVPVLMVIAGFSLGVISAIDIYKARKSVSWPIVSGHVVFSEAERGCRKGGSYYPHIQYLYTTEGGGMHRGSLVMFGHGPCGTESYAREFAERFPVGSAVKVSVNPNNMFESVLSPGVIRGETWFFVAAMAFLFVIGTSMTSRQLRAR